MTSRKLPVARPRGRTDTRLLVAEFRRIRPEDPRVEPEADPRVEPRTDSPTRSGVRARVAIVPRAKNGTDPDDVG